MIIKIGIFALLLSACQPIEPAATVMAPDGQPAIQLECRHKIDCTEESTKWCPYGYDVLDSDAQHMMIRCRRAVPGYYYPPPVAQ